ncbi:septal ring lytic transglycosylase RlpA family protein [Pseudahrensia aquimaris]|uniref:Endolytic peptidoglycan transglycosylase RlpA n=1 Tax=Pseudahrensia aquimaris TaxID=744461 RepID=A0ABW3FJZ3_9HYPH
MRLVITIPAMLSLAALSGCFYGSTTTATVGSAPINDKTKFSSEEYGVAASPRVTTSAKVRKGGGRRHVGKPYQVRGKWYEPKEEPGYNRTGQASWYGPNFHGRLTANGEVYDQNALSGAHPTFPLPSYARVTNLANGKSVVVRINDRGPFHDGRVIDLSSRAAQMLEYRSKGIANVRVEYVGPAPLHGLDEQYLAGTFREEGATQVASSSSSPPKPLPVLDTPRIDRSRLSALGFVPWR